MSGFTPPAPPAADRGPVTAAPPRRPLRTWLLLGLLTVQMIIAGVGAVIFLDVEGASPLEALVSPPAVICVALAVSAAMLELRRLPAMIPCALVEPAIMCSSFDVPTWAQLPMIAEAVLGVIALVLLATLLGHPWHRLGRKPAG